MGDNTGPIRTNDNVWINPRLTLGTANVEQDLRERFIDARERSRKRLERDELTYAEFLQLLLDVWEEYEEPRLEELES